MWSVCLVNVILTNLFDTGEWRVYNHDRSLTIEQNTDGSHASAPGNDPLKAIAHTVDDGSDLL